MTRPDSDHSADAAPARPSWLAEPCPRWCRREHHEQDHAEDRYHQSEATAFPAIVAVEPSVPATASLEALALVVWIGRYAGEFEEWAVIEPVEQREPRMVMTADSAAALARTLTAQLRDLRAD
jgi:hypothetical protein